MPTSHQYMVLLVEAALEGGKYLQRVKQAGGSPVVASEKHDIRLSADKEVEDIIRRKLHGTLPILGEEDGWDRDIADRSEYWIVDGLDGTVNFHYGLPLGGVSIALVRDGKPHLGVVYDFNHDELFTGEIGVGASMNGRPIHVSATKEASAALLLSALATKRDFSPESLAALGVFLGKWKKVRMLGSAALSLSYVACGRADACDLNAIMEWDIAAGMAIVEAAGGKVSITKKPEPYVIDLFAHNGNL